jgi:hypothetical protein
MINYLPARLGWFIHNMVAHPLMGILQLLGLTELSWKVHDKLCPADAS